MNKKKSHLAQEPLVSEIEAEVEVVEQLFTPLEWARQEGLNPVLFEKWKKESPMSKEMFVRLKEQVM